MQFPDVAGLCAHVTNLGAGSHIKKEGRRILHCVFTNRVNVILLSHLIFNAHHSNNACMGSFE